jgi:HSP20 family protein
MTLFLEPFAPLFDISRQLGGMRTFLPAADVVVTDDEVTVVMDVPGLKPEDVDVELREDQLTVRGERAMPYQADDDESRPQGWQRLERGFGKFERVLRLPSGLDPDAITASMSDGVLTLHIPKPRERKPRRIEITTGHSAETIEGAAADQRELAGATA